MAGASHDTIISIDVTLAPAATQVTGFGNVLLLVPLANNSLNGVRVASYATYEEAQTASTAGYISASTLEACRVAFANRPKIKKFKVGYVDLATSVVGVKASKDFGGVGTGAFDTIIEATTAGTDGNSITVELVGDSSSTVSITRSGTTFQIHFKPSTSTVSDVETAITALSGADDLIAVKTAGTGATVLAVADANMGATALTGGVDAVAVETYSTALTACIAYDSDFYGVCLNSRVAATITALGATVEASSKRMLLVAQNASATWLTGSLPSGITGERERTVYVYHDTDAQWNDVAYATNRLAFNPDEFSAPWHGHELAEVDALAATITSAQRDFLIANSANVGLPLGSADFVMDPGYNSNERPVYEIVSTDWFATRLRERIGDLIVSASNAGQKIVVSEVGATQVLGVIQGLYDQAVAVGHFIAPDPDDAPIIVGTDASPGITDADRAAQTLRFTVRAQIAVGARLFTFNVYASTDALSA